jgi:Radical SAM superfamily
LKTIVGGTEFRQSVLALIDPTAQPLPPNPSVAFVWPTELCAVACAHCSFGSRSRGPELRRELAHHPEKLVEWLDKAGATTLVACGGGEPLDEPEFLVRVIEACAQRGIRFEIYTSGVSSTGQVPVREYILAWRQAWNRANAKLKFRVRLSVDLFHKERIGLDPVVEWIREIEAMAPDWTLSLRGVRIQGDNSVAELAHLLGARFRTVSESVGRLTTSLGRCVLVEQKGFVFDGRGSTRALKRRGLRFTERDASILQPLAGTYGDNFPLGRPISARLTVLPHHMDLEIHSDCIVHLLESQAVDLRLSFQEYSWDQLKNIYYRDPIVHLVAAAGLPAVAALIISARDAGISQEQTIPFSIEKLRDRSTLDWITANAILRNQQQFAYDRAVIELARQYLSTQAR